MPGNVALDSNIVIAFLKGDAGIKENIDAAAGRLFLPMPVAGELVYGALKSSRVELNLKQNMAFIRNTILVPCNFSVAEQYAKIRVSLFENGTPLPENDIWIAACCLANNLPLATRDAHFDKISNIDLEKW